MNKQDAARCGDASACDASACDARRAGRLDADAWAFLADMYAFAGNSLLVPMSQSSAIGLDPGFWSELPSFGDDRLEEALAHLRSFAEEASTAEAGDGRASAEEDAARDAAARCTADSKALDASSEPCAAGCPQPALENAVRAVSVEFTHLFMGPPSPACPPWETYYRETGTKNGFGRATFEMREILRGLGLRASGPGNQFEDHAGLELLVLSEMCRRVADALGAPQGSAKSVFAGSAESSQGAEGASSDGLCAVSRLRQEAASFVNGRLAAWMSAFAASVASERPDGYHALLLVYVTGLLTWHGRALGPAA